MSSARFGWNKMTRPHRRTIRRSIIALMVALAIHGLSAAAQTDSTARYTYTTTGSRGGGKIYMGREIGQVLDHTRADWLERPNRTGEEQPDLLVSRLPLKPDFVVADIGAGSGYFTFRISPLVP
ncbi:MAG: hypothetical protein V3W14_13180, partial [Candidatus Neomarinimicrobiota bacterium]